INATTVIHPVHSREPFVNELIQATGARAKIAPVGDWINMHGKSPPYYDEAYTRLVETLPPSDFEFYRNKIFFEKLLNIELGDDQPRLLLNSCKAKNKIGLYVDALASPRRWSLHKFIELAEILVDKFPATEVILFGGKSYLPSKENLARLSRLPN